MSYLWQYNILSAVCFSGTLLHRQNTATRILFISIFKTQHFSFVCLKVIHSFLRQSKHCNLISKSLLEQMNMTVKILQIAYKSTGNTYVNVSFDLYK